MGTPIPGVRYYYDPTATAFKAPGRPDLGRLPTADENFRPVSYANLADARAALDAPANANYVMWTFGNRDLESVFANDLAEDDILVLPEREAPYLIDSSKGFMAADVKEVDATGADGLKNGTRSPIVSNSRLWFEMARARRGILGLGPGAVVAPSASSWSQGRQPITQNEPAGQQFQRAYFTNGGTMNLVGAQETLLGFAHAQPFFANFTLKGRSFGGVSYSGLKRTGGTGVHNVLKRVHFDGCWRAHAGVPNGECGGVTLNGGTYLIENCDFSPVNGGSPIMWNNNMGGAVRDVRSPRPDVGMWTFWRCGGRNVFENVYIDGRQLGMNLEETRAGFELDWTGGALTLDYPGNSKFHFGVNPSPPSSTGIAGGPPRITLKGVTCSPNAWTEAGYMTVNVYTTYGIAKRSYISCDTLPVSCVPASAWVN